MTNDATLTVVPRSTETTLTVVFGPSRSRFFDRALAHARAAAGWITERSPGRFQARFTLQSEPAVFAHLAALCELVGPWKATEIHADGTPIPGSVVREMGFCAAHQLMQHGACQVRFRGFVPPRCRACPLFDPGRARADLTRPRPGDRLRPQSAGPIASQGSSSRGRARRLRVVGVGDERPGRPIRFTVVFGPSRSWDFQRAIARAGVGASELTEGPDGSYRAEFVLAGEPGPYLALVRHARAPRPRARNRGHEGWSSGVPGGCHGHGVWGAPAADPHLRRPAAEGSHLAPGG